MLVGQHTVKHAEEEGVCDGDDRTHEIDRETQATPVLPPEPAAERTAFPQAPSTLESTRSKRSSASSMTSSVSAIDVYMREPASVITPLAV